MIDEVGALMRAAAARAIVPLFRRLGEDEVEEKSPGQLVTVADRRAEQIIADGLRELLPGSTVVGEEGVADDPAVLDHLREAGPVWLVDPLDGTANFTAGRPPFAVMVALRRDGVTRAGWILDPLSDSLLVAREHAGAYADGVAVRLPDAAPPVAQLRGALKARFLPRSMRAAVGEHRERLGSLLSGQHCAAQEYRDIVTGVQHFAVFWHTLPWDHTAGVLLVEEAGGLARRFDGSRYDPTDERNGLLIAANEEIWTTVQQVLMPTG